MDAGFRTVSDYYSALASGQLVLVIILQSVFASGGCCFERELDRRKPFRPDNWPRDRPPYYGVVERALSNRISRPQCDQRLTDCLVACQLSARQLRHQSVFITR